MLWPQAAAERRCGAKYSSTSLSPACTKSIRFGQVGQAMRFQKLTPETENFLHLDFLRFVAALGIVALHFRLSMHLPEGWVSNTSGRLDALAAFVDLFFLISGVVISYVYVDRLKTFGDYTQFLRKRVARLLPLHWATLAFYAVLGLVALKYVAGPAKYDWGCFVPNVLMIHSMGVCRGLSFNFVSWSISAEMAVYVLFPAFVLIYRRNPYLPAAIGVLMIIGLMLTGLPWWDWTAQFGFLRAIPAFLIGMSLYRLKPRVPYAGYLMFAALLLFFVGMLAGFPRWMLIPIVYVIPVLGLSADTYEKPLHLVRKLAPMGQLTYSVYMLHPLVITVLFTFLGDKLLHLAPLPKNLLVLLGFPIALFVGYISLTFFETPMRKIISGQRRVAAKPEAPSSERAAS
jgi:peptidoglycan/LPS O-acetylase OafA/YrhL